MSQAEGPIQPSFLYKQVPAARPELRGSHSTLVPTSVVTERVHPPSHLVSAHLLVLLTLKSGIECFHRGLVLESGQFFSPGRYADRPEIFTEKD